MVVERIEGTETGDAGWTVTWNGRGWWQTFDEYLELVRSACAIGRARGLLVVPSVKYHLPQPGETQWRTEEYEFTTRAILAAYHSGWRGPPLPLEKDFSPTLAGSDRAGQREGRPRLDRAACPALIRCRPPRTPVASRPQALQ